jgi:hypothetical protein
MPGPPGRFELSIAERLSPVLHAIERRRAQHRRMMTVLDHRGRTKEEAEIVQGP